MLNRAQAKHHFSNLQSQRSARTFLIGLGIWLLAGLASGVATFDLSLVLRPSLNVALCSACLLLGWWVAWRSPYRQLISIAYPSPRAGWMAQLTTILLVAVLSWSNVYVLLSMAHTAIGKEDLTHWTVSSKSLDSLHRMAWTTCPYRIRFKEAVHYPGGRQCISRAEFDDVQVGALWQVRVLSSPLGESRLPLQ